MHAELHVPTSVSEEVKNQANHEEAIVLTWVVFGEDKTAENFYCCA